MKKLGLVMPIMTIFLLASCGSAPTTKYTLIATCNNGTISGNKGQYEEGEDVALTFMADQGYYLPESKSNVICTGVDKSSITYISESGHLTFKMPSSPVSVTITAIEEDLWYLDEKYISNLNEDNIGTTRNLRVNGINHIVRLIGIDHDDLADGSGKAHTTWEFANLLSDSDGYSLAAVWNWEKGTSSINQNYLDSNLREVFDGGGKGGLYWYRKKQETSEQTQQTEYANKTVFDMLPSNLQNVIKEVKKPVATTSDYDVNTYNAKVFPLSYKEMTETISADAKDEGSTYAFYKGDGNTDANRIKYQVKWHDGAVKFSTAIKDGKCNASNYAGHNSTTNNKGGSYWLRSPCISENNTAWSASASGYISHGYFIYYRAYAVAPAFCI